MQKAKTASVVIAWCEEPMDGYENPYWDSRYFDAAAQRQAMRCPRSSLRVREAAAATSLIETKMSARVASASLFASDGPG